MKIAIISTGNELLRGLIADTNSAWIANRLDEAGYSVDAIYTIGDSIDAICQTLQEVTSKNDLTVITGGLGPTEDDLTAQAAANAAFVPIVRREDAVAQIRARFAAIKRNMPEINLKQADLPQSSTILDNPIGTAPGFAMEMGRGRAVFLPGVPREMKLMFENHVLNTLPSPEKPIQRISLRCFGRGESDIQETLAPVSRAYPGVAWSYRASFPEIGVTLTSHNRSELDVAVSEARKLLGKTIFAEGQTRLGEALGQALLQERLTLATAESCTGGLIGHTITDVPGSSAYYRGGVVAYHNDIKHEILGVNQATLDAHGAVSREVAMEMAKKVCLSHRADIGLAVSGIAGPTGGTPGKPVGLVHVAVAHPNGIEHKQRNFGDFGRSRIKTLSAWTAMWMAFEIARRTR